MEYVKLLQQVERIRSTHTKMGGRKLFRELIPFMKEHQIKMGRDAFFAMLGQHGLLIRKRQRRVATTYSNHWLRKYPNLIKGWQPERTNQLWVSDITYWKIASGFLYISLITDAYSRKIVGYHVSKNLEVTASLLALEMALDSLTGPVKGLIHHSDRGVQYCSHSYVNLLRDYRIQISMTENGDPLENPIAERINGIIKEEYLSVKRIHTFRQAEQALKEAVRAYNEERPHTSISFMKPAAVHQTNVPTKRLWKNYYKSQPVNPI